LRIPGCGIAPESLPHIFDRFYRADSSRDRRTGGNGLGLAIVDQIARQHGAQVDVRNVLEHGTAFLVRSSVK
jgi:signal transduction histidine kinase